MKKILVTAFVPFGNQSKNSSLEVVKKLKKQYQDREVVFVKLPVVYDIQVYENLLDIHKPDYVVMCGQAGKRKTVDLEKVAVNYAYSNSPDNKGIIIKGSRIAFNGPDALFTTTPILSLFHKLEEKKLPVGISFSAGTYVCNFAYYTMLFYAQRFLPKTQILFVHFPYYEKQVHEETFTLALNEMVSVLDLLLQLLLE